MGWMTKTGSPSVSREIKNSDGGFFESPEEDLDSDLHRDPWLVHCPCQARLVGVSSGPCELCHGTGLVDPGPTSVVGSDKHFVLMARYAAGLPLWNDEDAELEEGQHEGFLTALQKQLEREYGKEKV